MAILAMALALAAAQADATPNAAAIRREAAHCGLPANGLRYGHDADGDFADPVPLAPGQGSRFAAICLIAWAQTHHARVGFLSEPRPGPQALAIVPGGMIAGANRAAASCGLPIRMDAYGRNNEGRIMIRRLAPPAPLACMRAWLTTQRVL